MQVLEWLRLDSRLFVHLMTSDLGQDLLIVSIMVKKTRGFFWNILFFFLKLIKKKGWRNGFPFIDQALKLFECLYPHGLG